VGAGEAGKTQVEAAEAFATRALELDPGSEEAAELVQGIRTAMAELEGLGMDSVLVLPSTALGKEIQRSLAEAGVRERRPEGEQVRGVLRLMAAGRMEQAVDLGEDLLDEGIEDALLFEAVEQGYRVSGSLGDVPAVVELRYGPEEAAEVDGLIDDEGVEGYWRWKRGRMEADGAAGRPLSPTVAATARMADGDGPGAIQGLRTALSARDPLLALVRHDATWDPIRATQAFQETLRFGRSELRRALSRPPGG
jgi:hypothetical protein